MLNISGLKLPFIAGIPVTGNVYFVDSGSGITNDENRGVHPTKSPCATWEGAYDKCTADNGDMVILMPGHAETITTAIALDTAGVTTLGVGNGDNRPIITVNAAVNGLDITGDDQKIVNVQMETGSSVTAATRFIRVAASDVEIAKCKCVMTYDMYHNVVVISGDNVVIDDCVFMSTVTTSAGVHPQTCILNTTGTHVVVKNSYFNDCGSKKAERWRAVVESGALATHLEVRDCTFVVRGIATRTRSAGASDGTGTGAPSMSTLYCRSISPSANTSAGAAFTPTYQYIVESYDVAAINKVALVAVTTSDKRLKTAIMYL